MFPCCTCNDTPPPKGESRGLILCMNTISYTADQ